MPLVEQELPTVPDHMSSPPVLVGFVLLDLYFMRMFCRTLFVLFRFTDYDDAFDIFKLSTKQIKRNESDSQSRIKTCLLSGCNFA